jgi:hypothetical protein
MIRIGRIMTVDIFLFNPWYVGGSHFQTLPQISLNYSFIIMTIVRYNRFDNGAPTTTTATSSRFASLSTKLKFVEIGNEPTRVTALKRRLKPEDRHTNFRADPGCCFLFILSIVSGASQTVLTTMSTSHYCSFQATNLTLERLQMQ